MGAKSIEKACIAAKEKLAKLKIEDEIQSKLEWVLGSYANDGNPVGLYEIGEKALEALQKYKKVKPRQVANKLVEDLEKAITKK